MDDKDLEIARLKGQLEGMEAAKQKDINPVRILAWLVLGALGLFVALVLFGMMIPQESDEERGRRIAASINATCDPKWTGSEESAGECRMKEFQRRADEIAGR